MCILILRYNEHIEPFVFLFLVFHEEKGIAKD